mmetsp:Transcript_84/g.154  ORF Transcript_84/g.154 Transcript_84/m.154 type:complete len:111 (-) Transcript_84:59-391(-)
MIQTVPKVLTDACTNHRAPALKCVLCCIIESGFQFSQEQKLLMKDCHICSAQGLNRTCIVGSQHTVHNYLARHGDYLFHCGKTVLHKLCSTAVSQCLREVGYLSEAAAAC